LHQSSSYSQPLLEELEVLNKKVSLEESVPLGKPHDSFGVVFICTEPTVSAR